MNGIHRIKVGHVAPTWSRMSDEYQYRGARWSGSAYPQSVTGTNKTIFAKRAISSLMAQIVS
jgi:hypothetical protein